jgi:hypothetical protein
MAFKCTVAKALHEANLFVGRTYQGLDGLASFIVEALDRESVTIRDRQSEFGGESVADCAEPIVRRLRAVGLLKPERRLFFYDSAGRLDEILWQCPGSAAA